MRETIENRRPRISLLALAGLAEKYGGAEFAIQVKGLEMAAYDPRGAWGQGLSYATANRGACHLSSTLFSVETFLGLAYPRTMLGKPALVVFFENLFAAVNSMHLCVFTGFPFGLEPALIRRTPRPLMRLALAALARIAVNNRRDVAEIKKFYQEHDLMGALRRTLLDDKTMKLLLDKAEITAGAPEPAQPAEEKDEKE